jgi:DNA repair ATPase RecN
MTNEEVERTMQFILEQQAQTDTRLGILTERLGTLTEKVDVLSVNIDALSVNIDALSVNIDVLATNQIKDKERLKRVEDTFLLLTTMAQRHEERLDELGEAQTRTAEQLTSLANTVERYINESRNGQN